MTKIIVGKGSCGIAAGAQKLSDYLHEQLKAKGVPAEIGTTGCIGMCYLEPMVDIIQSDSSPKTYTKLTTDAADEIIKMLAGEDNNAEAFALTEKDADVLAQQVRVALRYCGVIDPENIGAYMALGGYAAAKRALTEMTPQSTIDEMKTSGLGGRGGAGGFHLVYG